MTSSAGSTAFKSVAVSALVVGALAFGCTTASVNDPNGGNRSDGGTNTNNDAAGGDGSDSAAPLQCEHYQQAVPIGSAQCHACLETNCCREFNGFYDLPNGSGLEGGPGVSPKDYGDFVRECSRECGVKTGGEYNAQRKCVAEECESVTSPAMVTAYQTMFACIQRHVESEERKCEICLQ